MERKTKAEYRKSILAVRNAMPRQERQEADFIIAERVLGHNWFWVAEKILVYVNTGSEVSTQIIMEEAFRKQKQVFAPKVNGEEMSFFQITSREQLAAGFKGILEPIAGLPQFGYEKEKDKDTLILMPGVVFDRSRNRIGYGKGYYDRFLQDKPLLHKMALAYECQIVEELEAQVHDCRPDVIITQAGKTGGFR